MRSVVLIILALIATSTANATTIVSVTDTSLGAGNPIRSNFANSAPAVGSPNEILGFTTSFSPEIYSENELLAAGFAKDSRARLVPESSTLGLIGTGLVGVAALMRAKLKREARLSKSRDSAIESSADTTSNVLRF